MEGDAGACLLGCLQSDLAIAACTGSRSLRVALLHLLTQVQKEALESPVKMVTFFRLLKHRMPFSVYIRKVNLFVSQEKL